MYNWILWYLSPCFPRVAVVIAHRPPTWGAYTQPARACGTAESSNTHSRYISLPRFLIYRCITSAAQRFYNSSVVRPALTLRIQKRATLHLWVSHRDIIPFPPFVMPDIYIYNYTGCGRLRHITVEECIDPILLLLLEEVDVRWRYRHGSTKLRNDNGLPIFWIEKWWWRDGSSTWRVRAWEGEEEEVWKSRAKVGRNKSVGITIDGWFSIEPKIEFSRLSNY